MTRVRMTRRVPRPTRTVVEGSMSVRTLTVRPNSATILTGTGLTSNKVRLVAQQRPDANCRQARFESVAATAVSSSTEASSTVNRTRTGAQRTRTTCHISILAVTSNKARRRGQTCFMN